MFESTNLQLPYIEASQAQKHVTYNDAIRKIDVLIQVHALSRNLIDPPSSPQEGDVYVIAIGATGDWQAKENHTTAFQDGAWAFQPLKPGLVVWLNDESVLAVWDGNQWVDMQKSDETFDNLASLGINATADSTNKLSVSSSDVLFNHDGSDIRHKLNKNTAGDTASFLFQNGFSARAEIGLTGDDDFHFKVSPDGSTFHDAIVIDKNTGETTFPSNAELPRRPGYMGEFLNVPNSGVLRFNLRLKGIDVDVASGIYALITGYAYGSSKALDMVFVGYNYPPVANVVINQHIVDRAGTGLATGFTKTASFVYLWFESNSYYVNGALEGMKVHPFLGQGFDIAAGFDLVLTTQGVDVTD